MYEFARKGTKLITRLANKNKQNTLQIIPMAINENIGLYGFINLVVGAMMKPVEYSLSHLVDNQKDNLLTQTIKYNNKDE